VTDAPPVPALAAQADRVQLAAPAFISDLHLNAAQPATRAAFARFVAEVAPRFAELVILGDLFEYWAGDDDDDPLGRDVASSLRALSARIALAFKPGASGTRAPHCASSAARDARSATGR